MVVGALEREKVCAKERERERKRVCERERESVREKESLCVR